MREGQRLAEEARRILQEAVIEALDRKRRLGQYAVVGENGNPVRIGRAEIARLLLQPASQNQG